MTIYHVMTLKEASDQWGFSSDYLRQCILKGKFDELIKKGEVRKSGSTWFVTLESMKAVFGELRKSD
ncbi:helix-turn-helix domain-containing protein [Fictibacillus sp. B-59209]|uniref:helix-turn-helix domain-containing protein n=1 Tax=Fictibacillus sp. B-59209 TaxID=3024873 RepID=UPI002E1C032D|nr:helix-turn-helix domain-containing protein [Fictibacillus sp. B-59209]